MKWLTTQMESHAEFSDGLFVLYVNQYWGVCDIARCPCYQVVAEDTMLFTDTIEEAQALAEMIVGLECAK